MSEEMTRNNVHCSNANGRTPLPITDLIVSQAHRRGQMPYLTAIDRRGETETITFAGLEARTRRLAGWLAARHGVRAGSRVALSPVNDMPSVLAIFALMRLGAVTVMLNPADPVERHTQLLDGARAELLLRPPRTDFGIISGAVEIPDTLQLDNTSTPFPTLSTGSDAFLIGTSGSTAASKIVRQTHGNTAANAADTVTHHGITPGQNFLGCLPIHHVNGLHFTLMTSIVAGSHSILLAGFDPLTYPRIMERVKPRIASVVPSILEALASVWRGRELPDGFGYFVSAAAPLSSETVLAVDRAIGARIVQGYGLSETTNFSCTMPPMLCRAEYEALMIDSPIPSVGRALSNEITVLDGEGRACEEETIGEIAMRGPNVMAGYFGNQEATSEAFRHDWFRSGDLGYAIRHGGSGEQLFVLTGRLKNIAKVRGESVSLDEMDRVLRQLAGVVDAACVARPDKRSGDSIVAAVVAPHISDEEIQAHLARAFPPVMLPSHIVRLASIPRTTTGKVRRPELKAEVSASDCQSKPT